MSGSHDPSAEVFHANSNETQCKFPETFPVMMKTFTFADGESTAFGDGSHPGSKISGMDRTLPPSLSLCPRARVKRHAILRANTHCVVCSRTGGAESYSGTANVPAPGHWHRHSRVGASAWCTCHKEFERSQG